MGWFQVSRGRLEYRGRIARQPFTEWAATKEGAAAVARVAAGIRFSLLGRSHAARRRMWRAIESASRDERVAAAFAAEAGRYMTFSPACRTRMRCRARTSRFIGWSWCQGR